MTLSSQPMSPDPNSPATRVRVSVSDTGPGIAKEHQKKIFEKFTQLDSTHTREFSGTGLGLTISLELANLLHSELVLDSELGKGSTFSLVIPINFPGQIDGPNTESKSTTA
ncbi:MAG: hypothetical protein JKX85_01785 [Phycisphaeraceae bacterium]|nr:hypothetical protein [Phycisphaeraceae bacterium]